MAGLALRVERDLRRVESMRFGGGELLPIRGQKGKRGGFFHNPEPIRPRTEAGGWTLRGVEGK